MTWCRICAQRGGNNVEMRKTRLCRDCKIIMDMDWRSLHWYNPPPKKVKKYKSQYRKVNLRGSVYYYDASKYRERMKIYMRKRSKLK